MEFNSANIHGRQVTVLGAGRSGIAAARLLKEKGVYVFLSEQAPLEEKRTAAEILDINDIPYEFGGHTSKVFNADLCVVSPGISVSSSIIQQIRKKGITVLGELEIASWFCQASIVAVTGSNGKSTATSLLGEVFKQAGRSYIVAGNIGQPFSDYVEKTVPDGVAILEVSSFQLETIQNFHPHVAVFLNLTPDHLNRHGDMKNYGKIKSRIFENQTNSDYIVFNEADNRVSELTYNAKSRRIAFGIENDSIWCGFVRKGILTLRLGKNEEMLIPVKEMGIKGEHNVSNALAVALSSRLLGVDTDTIRKAFRIFRGLPHRMEFVRKINEVEWVNDSKATNVDSVWYALGSFKVPIVLIGGGRDKDSDFTVLRDRIKENVRCVILIGEAAEKMEKAFQGICEVKRVFSLREAVEEANLTAKSGDVVLLSPGCTSFDMFIDFEDRGEQFKGLVQQL